MGNTLCTHLQLVGALLTTDVEDSLLRHLQRRLQLECGLADARFAAQEHDGAWYEATA